MIQRIDFTDINNAPISYLSDIDFFKKNKSVSFKSGVNVIVGLNGCGKTTLLNLIRRYTLCLNSTTSTCPSGNLEFSDLLTKYGSSDNICDGVKIISDYQGVVFNMLEHNVLERRENFLQDRVKFQSYFNNLHCSTGEGISNGLDMLFKTMFDSKTNLEFPFKKLKEIANSDFFPHQDKAKQLLQYYKENSFQYDNPADFEFTVLMDEPDRNLDINRVKEIYDILTHKKENTQIIAVIHNPILIYKLSKCSHVNIVEMTENYVEDVVKFVEDAK
jgi:hypothetical protein